MAVAFATQELGDLGLDGGLHEQPHPEPGHLLQHLAQLPSRAERSSISARMRSIGDTRVVTGVGSFLCLQASRGTYARRLFTPRTGRHHKLLESAQARWRKITGAELVALVRAGVTFIDGKQQERSDTTSGSPDTGTKDGSVAA
ncbi:MAG TPA: hypothetical protein VKU92_03355 [Acidimicrobiales bacterium]|nr:hypothetical protein [Acidimicrobiales bacterium]